MNGSEIAVIGLAGRFPGARDAQEFWRNLRDGVESIKFFNEDELLAAGESRDKLSDPSYVRSQGALAGVDLFDAEFFGFSPQDAAIMDPQHRILLEVAWGALENAGYDTEQFRGSVGVFATCGMNSYMMHNLVNNRRIMETVGEWLVRHTGNDMNFLATRLSYEMNLKGPSMNVQTACSSALVAIHQASQSLLNGECDMALAGGCTLTFPLNRGYQYKPGEILSPDGHCRSFDARAAGTVFGSGAGMVVLRRLSDAIADGDHISAVVLGSAINNDGSAKVGYLAPSVDGQSKAVLEALATSGVDPKSISLIEAHGTGTNLGDPVEVAALTQAYQRHTLQKEFCAIGSVKPNIGHLGEAAGAAGFIKVVEALRHRQLPPSLNFESPNPQIDFANSPFYVNSKLRDWKSRGPRRAGITALGAGGTNCHVIVEEAPRPEPSGSSRPWQLLTLSAVTPVALEAASANLAEHLETHPEISAADVAYTMNVGRKAFAHRRSIVCKDHQGAIDELAKAPAATKAADAPSVTFLFPGQGSQYPRMGWDLYQGEPVFRDTVDRCARILQPLLKIDLRELLYSPADVAEEHYTIKQTEIAQPALFVIEYALAKLWMSWGVKPQAMIGHSVGEYVAACLAGVFTLEDALALVAARGKLMQQMPAGAMAAVPLSAIETERLMNGAGSSGRLSLAAANAPALSVVAGSNEVIEEFEKTLAVQGVECQRLHTSHAFHSSMMDPILAPFRERVRAIELNAPGIPFISNLSGTWIKAEEATDPEYWVRHLRNAVRFTDGIATLLAEPNQVMLEAGPGSALTTLVRQQPSKPVAVLTSMRRYKDATPDDAHLLGACGKLWAAGASVDWKAFWGKQRRHRVELPTYPFQRQRYWIDADAITAAAPMLGAPQETLSKKSDISDWFYLPSWKRSVVQPGRAKNSVLIFTDETGLGDALAAKLASSPASPVALEQTDLGEIESLAWQSQEHREPGKGEVAIEVRATALNFADVLKATGAFPEAPFGMECAGVISAVGAGVTELHVGDEVVAIGPGSHASRVIRDARFVARKPESLSFEDAVTLPAAYMTAWYSLHEVGKLKRGEKILIHAASGGVGLAAVELARRTGAEIYATAGSTEKREYLKSIGIAHVYSSRTLEFAEQIDRVDVVLNSLTGDFIPKSMGLLAPGGRFLEIGKKDILSADEVPAGIDYSAIDLVRMLRDDPEAYGALLRSILPCPALPKRVFSMTETVAAFQHMLQTRHIGKVVLSIDSPKREVYRVRAGKTFKKLDERSFIVNPSHDADYSALMESLGPAAERVDAAVHLWNVTGEPSKKDSVEQHLNRGFFSLMGLAKALGKCSRHIDICVVSNRLQDVAGETQIEPGKATLLGPCRVIPREFENLTCRSIDIGVKGIRERVVEQLSAELASSTNDRTIAYRDDSRWVQSVEAAPHNQVAPGTGLREKGVYLVTGGLGGIGLALAEHLAAKVHARLVLVSRRTPSARQRERIRTFDALAIQADVSDPQQMRRAIKQARAKFGTIHGVFHTAGVLNDGLIQLKESAAAMAVLAPKVNGAVALEESLRQAELDFVVLFSSVSSLLGLEGQVDYTAANAFLDAFAQHRSKHGRTRVISIDWGAWKEVGFASGRDSDAVTMNLSTATHWLLAEHAMRGSDAVLPGTGYLDLARAAFEERSGHGPVELREVMFQAPFIVPRGGSKQLDVTLKNGEFSIQSDSQTHVAGKIGRTVALPPRQLDLESIRQRCDHSEDAPNGFLKQGFMDFGPRWGNIQSIRYGNGEALLSLCLPDEFVSELPRFRLHPALLDMATGGAQKLISGFNPSEDFYVPFSYGRLVLSDTLPARLCSHIRVKQANGLATFDITLTDENGWVVAEIADFAMRRAGSKLSIVEPTSARSQAGHAAREGMMTAEGMQALERILGNPAGPQVIVSPLDLPAWMKQIDQSAQPVRQIASASGSSAALASGKQIERRLSEIWSSILGVEAPGLTDDFFDLGGHSLLLVRLAARVEKEFKKTIPLSFLFQSATIERMAEYLREDTSTKPQFFVPFNEKGTGPAFFCVHSMGGDAIYRNLARRLDPEQRFYGVQIPPELRTLEFTASVEGMAHRYVQELIEFQPQGPYILGGRSAGATVALEMAQQLRAGGREVALLISMDGAPFNSGAGTRGTPKYLWKLLRNAPHWVMEDLIPGFSLTGFARRLKNKLMRPKGFKLAAERYFYGAEFTEGARAVMDSFYRSVMRYLPRRYDGRVLLYQASAEALFELHEVDLTWKQLTSDIEIVAARGNHQTMVDDAHIAPLADNLNQHLREFRKQEVTLQQASGF